MYTFLLPWGIKNSRALTGLLYGIKSSAWHFGDLAKKEGGGGNPEWYKMIKRWRVSVKNRLEVFGLSWHFSSDKIVPKLDWKYNATIARLLVGRGTLAVTLITPPPRAILSKGGYSNCYSQWQQLPDFQWGRGILTVTLIPLPRQFFPGYVVRSCCFFNENVAFFLRVCHGGTIIDTETL